MENVGRRSQFDGDVSQFINVGNKSFNGYEHNSLFQIGSGGEYIDVAAVCGADRIEDTRGLAVADLDNDGDQDIVLQNYRQSAKVLINSGTTNHWLQVSLRGVESNRSAIGAHVTIRYGGKTQSETVTCGEAYLSCRSRVLHFGLADAAQVAEVRVRWPSGRVEIVYDVDSNQRLRIVEGEGVQAPVLSDGGSKENS